MFFAYSRLVASGGELAGSVNKREARVLDNDGTCYWNQESVGSSSHQTQWKIIKYLLVLTS
jgi:hypothetical protein